MLNGLDLFSGVGGLTVALEKWVRPVAYCENDRHAQAVLLSRMSTGDIPKAPIWDDVCTLGSGVLAPVRIDIIYGGFPCQDISSAGRRAGLEGERSGLFFEIVRLTRELRPSFIFLENVPAITVRGLERVLAEFTALGFDCRWTIVSAAEVGAPHLRERWWLLGHDRHAKSVLWPTKFGSESDGTSNWCGTMANTDSNPIRKQPKPESGRKETGVAGGHGEAVADTESIGRIKGWTESARKQGGFDSAISGPLVADPSCKLRERSRTKKSLGEHPDGSDVSNTSGERRDFEGIADAGKKTGRWTLGGIGRPGWWSFEPGMGRVAHGVPLRVDRLRGLGNAVVPATAREAFERLGGLK